MLAAMMSSVQSHWHERCNVGISGCVINITSVMILFDFVSINNSLSLSLPLPFVVYDADSATASALISSESTRAIYCPYCPFLGCYDD